MTRTLLAATSAVAFAAALALPAHAEPVVCVAPYDYLYACVDAGRQCYYGSLGAEADFGSRECREG